MKLFRKGKSKVQREGKSSALSKDITLNTPSDGELLSAMHVASQTETGYLAGQFLVSTPLIDSGCFQKSVVYLFAHSAEGAMGVIVNQPLELLNYGSLFEGMDLPKEISAQKIPVYFGGPVERTRGFVVHSTDYYRDFSLARSTELAVTASNLILKDIALGQGPAQSALVVGYAGWSAGQLEAEIEANSWITVPATAELMFGTDSELRWAKASKSLGIDMAFYSSTVGHA